MREVDDSLRGLVHLAAYLSTIAAGALHSDGASIFGMANSQQG